MNLSLADSLLHIGREAIVNAISHSGLTVLKIELNYTRKSVDLIVEDNGCGFDVTPENTGFGILGMQKRARDIGAVLQILSSPGRGTKIWVMAEMQHEKLFKQAIIKIKSWLSIFHSIHNCRMLGCADCCLIQEDGSGSAG
jgi:signal transduction histidine kinase